MAGERSTSNGIQVSSYLGRLRKWVLLKGHRLHVMALTDGILLAFLMLVSLSPLSPYTDLQTIYLVFSRMIGGNLTIVSIVVVLNQLLISRELQTPDEFRSQMEGVLDYREDIEKVTGRRPPVEPLGLLRFLNESTRGQVQQIEELLDDTSDETIADELAQLSHR